MISEDSLRKMTLEYMAMILVKNMRCFSTAEFEWSDVEEEDQKRVLMATVKHPISILYPPSLSYRRSFMKTLLAKLEASSAEVCDEFYEEYSVLLSTPSDDQVCYKTYFIVSGFFPKNDNKSPRDTVTLTESTKLISQGTTGLNTWPAAQHLVEWALEHPADINDKRVLELGSGLGFTGIALFKMCKMKEYIFSDCHHGVLQTLEANIKINITQDNTTDVSVEENNILLTNTAESSTPDSTCKSEDSILKLKRSNSSVEVTNIDWENVSDEELTKLGARIDLIIATDVVYDLTIIPSLVRVLGKLLKHGAERTLTAIVASTVRNEATYLEFTRKLGEESLNHEVLAKPESHNLTYDRSVPIEIIRIKCTE